MHDMLTTLATLAAVTLTLPQAKDSTHEGRGQGRGSGQGAGQGVGDTTFAVPNGTRLDVNNFGGEIVVHTWNQNQVRVRASHSSRSWVNVSMSTSTVLVRTEGRRGPPSIVDLDITVPAWMGMALGGTYTDIRVENAGGSVSAESVQGDIEVVGGTGNITLKTVEGGVTLSKTKGRTEVNSVEGDISITDASGDITVESVDGDITMVRIDATNVEVNTVDGDIVYDGTIKSSGSYRLATHDGDVTIVIPSTASVSGSVSTFDGDFDASFPVDTVRAGRHRFTFTAGRGGNPAKVEIETFDGNIRLRRPGEVEYENGDQHKMKWRNHDEGGDSSWSLSLVNLDLKSIEDYARSYARSHVRSH